MRRPSIRSALCRTSVLSAGLLALGAMPTLAGAQQRDSVSAAASPKPGSVLHTVRPGDTLFDIARRYLGNPFRWPELFRANAAQIANANLIFPGQRLFVGADGRPTFTPPDVAEVAEGPVARTVPLGRNPSGQAVSVLENATIDGRALRQTVRPGEANAAPLLVSDRTRQDGGALISRADPSIIAAAHDRDQFQLFDEVNVLLPVGARAEIGQRYGVYRPGVTVRYGKRRMRLVEPTGVVEILALGTGRAARARVASQFQSLERGDLLISLDTGAVVPSTVRPQAEASGPIYDVAYIDDRAVLPTVQKYVVIALPAGAITKPGDEFTLFVPGEPLTEGRKDVAPASDVARVSVVRVTSEAATAVLIGHFEPAIQVGMKARLVARMP